MPRKWQAALAVGGRRYEATRDSIMHTLGNLTLLTSKLNSKVSNAAWATKRFALHEHDVLKLNADMLGQAGETWTEPKISARNEDVLERSSRYGQCQQDTSQDSVRPKNNRSGVSRRRPHRCRPCLSLARPSMRAGKLTSLGRPSFFRMAVSMSTATCSAHHPVRPALSAGKTRTVGGFSSLDRPTTLPGRPPPGIPGSDIRGDRRGDRRSRCFRRGRRPG